MGSDMGPTSFDGNEAEGSGYLENTHAITLLSVTPKKLL